jgi:hypothetical protein
MKEIPLSKGKVALVDDEDYGWLTTWKWFVNKDGYAARNTPRPDQKTVLMHRVLMQTPDEMQTDHIDGDKLDNQKSNLRICTETQNHQNTNRHLNIHGYKGIEYDKRAKRWYAHIRINKINTHIGSYGSAEEAARAYDDAAKKYHGEFASLNFGGEK